MNRDAVSSIEDMKKLLPKTFSGQHVFCMIDESFKNRNARDNCERIASGRIFIQPNLALDNDLIQWIRKLEDVMGWRIFATKEHFDLIGDSFFPQKKGVDRKER